MIESVGTGYSPSLLPSYLKPPPPVTPTRMPGEGGAPNPGPPITLTGPAGSGVPGPGNTFSSPPPTGGSDPGYTPQNPQNLLASDPAYKQAQADYQAALDAAAASRDASLNRALVQFGIVPDFGSIGRGLGLSDAQIKAITGEINSSTGALADQYTQSGNSVIGQLNRAHDLALKQLQASLAARGVLESGATGVGVGEENHNLQQGMSNAYQQLIDNLLGFQKDYATAAGDARTNLENSLSSAYDRAIQLAQNVPGYGSTEPSGGAAPAQTVDIGGGHIVSVPATPPVGRTITAAPLPAPKKKPPLMNPYTTGRKLYG